MTTEPLATINTELDEQITDLLRQSDQRFTKGRRALVEPIKPVVA